MNMEEIFKIVVVIFTVSNLAAMGLEIKPREAISALKNLRFVLLILIWGWVAGPLIAWLITRVLPLSEPHAAGLMLISMAPTAPFFPMMVRNARGDMSSAGAFMLVATVGTVLFLPLQVPLLIKGLTVDTWALAQPLLTMVLLPLVIALGIKVYQAPLADKLFPWVKRIGGVSLLITAVLTGVLYYRPMLSAVGSFAIGAQLLLLVMLTVIAYRFGFGLPQGQRSALALGMCTRNIAAVFVAYFGISDPDPGIFVMIVLVVPLALIVALLAARMFAMDAKQEAVSETEVDTSAKNE